MRGVKRAVTGGLLRSAHSVSAVDGADFGVRFRGDMDVFLHLSCLRTLFGQRP